MDYSLYLVTDRKLAPDLAQSVEQAIIGGCTLVQLREKEVSSREFYETAVCVKRITDRYRIPLLINDRVDLAQAVDAAGVHIGQNDLPLETARKILGGDKIIGVSAATLEEAQKAEQDGADYLGVGAVFTTQTKTDTRAVSMRELAAIKSAVKIPVVAIGGIQEQNLRELSGTGVDGIAVVSAILGRKDIAAAAREMKKRFEQIEQ